MTNLKKLVEQCVNLDGYSTSPGFIGYFERKSSQSNLALLEVAGTAVDTIKEVFGDCSVLISSLYVDSTGDFSDLKEVDGYSSSDIEQNIMPLVECGVIHALDFHEIESQCATEEEFEAYLDRQSNLLRSMDDVPSKMIELACQEKIVGPFGLYGHLFLIYPDPELILYPHDDRGFGFISTSSDTRVGHEDEIVLKLPEDFRFVSMARNNKAARRIAIESKKTSD